MSTLADKSTATEVTRAAEAFMDSLIISPHWAVPQSSEEIRITQARVEAGNKVLAVAGIVMTEHPLKFGYVKHTMNDGDGTRDTDETANPVSGLSHYWLELIAQAVRKVAPINQKEVPELSAKEWGPAITTIKKWIVAAQPMPPIQLNGDGEMLRNDTWLLSWRDTLQQGQLPHRVRLTDSIHVRPRADSQTSKPGWIGIHVGCEGDVYLRHSSRPEYDTVFCQGCGLREKVRSGITHYDELSRAWCSPGPRPFGES